MLDFSSRRALKLIDKAIKKLDLDLSGQIVLTEVGSNYYLYTPIIAALAGAEKVYAVTKDSRFGKGEDIKNQCLQLARVLNVEDKIEIAINSIPEYFYENADIVTNSGNLRPLHAEALSKLKSDAVLPLMYEKWEVRYEDVDVEFCMKRGIKVAGTWEEHPDINVFGACGQLAIKLANEAGYEVFGNNIIVWSDDHFGEIIAEAFNRAGANSVLKTIDTNLLNKDFSQVDFVFLCDYDEVRPYFGVNGFMNLHSMLEQNNAFGLIHLYGDVDNLFLEQQGVNVYPNRRGVAKFMTQTLGYVGLQPIINLQVAGFKVGELMKKNQVSALAQYF